MPLENSPASETRVSCCIAGGGPAGMLLGLLLARAGVEVLVLEKHADFLRDFRGDTIHPSTLEIMYELGLLEEFLDRPHQEVKQLGGQIGDETVIVANFSHLPTHCKFIALMPQWEFLDFIADHAKLYPTFHLMMEAEVTELSEDSERVVGVWAETPNGRLKVTADLVIGADGRSSTVREQAKLQVDEYGVPIDVLWFRISQRAEDGGQTLGRIRNGKILVMLNRGDYWQCAFVIQKGEFEKIKQRGIDSFRNDIVGIAPFLEDRAAELRGWDDIKLLTVRVDRLREWHRPGVLCIGDAAHAMSPIGGVGINLAIQDAVATANLLAEGLKEGTLTTTKLGEVQKRREFPTRVIQGVQLFLQNQIISRVLGSTEVSLPWPLRVFRKFPILTRIPARIVGVGVRPEHVKTRDAFASGEQGTH